MRLAFSDWSLAPGEGAMQVIWNVTSTIYGNACGYLKNLRAC